MALWLIEFRSFSFLFFFCYTGMVFSSRGLLLFIFLFILLPE